MTEYHNDNDCPIPHTDTPDYRWCVGCDLEVRFLEEFTIEYTETRYYRLSVKIRAEDINQAEQKLHDGDYDDLDVEVIEYTTERS